MPAVTLGFAEVEAKLGLLRRRLNLHHLQDAVYLTSALLAAALSALVSLALGGTPAAFSYALWVTVPLIGTVAAVSLMSVRRRWLSLEKTARLADERAQLEDRLATLVAHPGAAEDPSPLAQVLLSQVTTLSGRWEAAAVAPVRIPRSFFLLLAALVLLVTTVLMEQRPPVAPVAPQSEAGARSAPDTLSAPAAAEPRPSGDSEVSAGAGSRQEPRGQDDTSVVHGTMLSGSRGPGAADRHNQQASAGAMSGGDHGQVGSASEAAENGPPRGDQLASKIQDLIRQAFGAESLAPPGQVSGRQKRDSDRHASDQESGRQPGTDRQQRADAKPNGPDGSGSAANQPGSHDASAGAENAAQRGSGSGAARGTGTTPLGSPGTNAASNRAGSASETSALQTFTIKLTGTSRVIYTTMEPQRGRADERFPISDTASTGVPDQPLAPQSAQQRGLHRTAIPAEHEATVRRIFSRQPEE